MARHVSQRVSIICPAHRRLGPIVTTWYKRNGAARVVKSTEAAIVNHRRAWNCDAGMLLEIEQWPRGWIEVTK